MNKAQRDIICFVHMERAGGTTLHAVFRNNFPLSFCSLTPWYLWSNEAGNELSPHEVRWLLRLLPHTRGFGGHTVRSYLDYERAVRRPVRYVTFLRDPVSRYLSHFNYQVNRMGMDWTIDRFLTEERFNNYMTCRIAGSDDVELAKRRLCENFAFVGITERFDESLLLMRQQLGLDDFVTLYEHENASHDPSYRSDQRLESPEVLEQARKNNALDIELYRTVTDRIFPRYIECFEGDFEEALMKQREACGSFTFNRTRRRSWLAYRHLLYRHLEWALHRLYSPRWRRQHGSAGSDGRASIRP